MVNGFEEAREQRNWLERLGEKIPGFRGYQDRELRRDVDRRQREFLSRELGRLKTAVRGKARDYTDAGQIGVLHLFERLDRRLDGLSQAVRFANYGASGLFDVEKIGGEALDRLYQFDLSLLEDLDAMGAAVALVPDPGDGDSKPALDQLLDLTDGLRDKWSGRDGVISSVVQR